MNLKSRLAILGSVALLATTVSAQIVVYDNLSTSALAGYSEPNANNPIFGDTLTLAQGGQASIFGFSLFNSTSGGNTGSILTGNMLIRFYDNTVPYSGGVLNNPLIASYTATLDLTADPLPAGYYLTDTFDLTSLNILLPQNVLITQQFTLTSGTSTRNGFILFSNPVVGSSPANVYMRSSATAEGLYTFSAGNPNQVGYHLEIVPEPSSLALAGLGLAAIMGFRRRS